MKRLNPMELYFDKTDKNLGDELDDIVKSHSFTDKEKSQRLYELFCELYTDWKNYNDNLIKSDNNCEIEKIKCEFEKISQENRELRLNNDLLSNEMNNLIEQLNAVRYIVKIR